MSWFRHLVRMSPRHFSGEVFWACPSGSRDLGADQGHAEKLVSSRLAQYRLDVPPGGVGGGGWGEEHLDLPAQTVAPVTRTQGSSSYQMYFLLILFFYFPRSNVADVVILKEW